MADCSYARCVQERRFIKRELQKWNKDMVYIVGEYTLTIYSYFRTILFKSIFCDFNSKRIRKKNREIERDSKQKFSRCPV